MIVLLLRHGPAGSHDPLRWPSDRQRPLTAKGEERTRAAAMGLARISKPVSVVMTSPLLRALQTATIAAEAFGVRRIDKLDALAPGGALRDVVAALAERDPSDVILLVGHEPDLGALAGRLLFGASATALGLKKAGTLAIEFDERPVAGHGRLLWLLPPRVLRRLGGRKVKS